MIKYTLQIVIESGKNLTKEQVADLVVKFGKNFTDEQDPQAGVSAEITINRTGADLRPLDIPSPEDIDEVLGLPARRRDKFN